MPPSLPKASSVTPGAVAGALFLGALAGAGLTGAGFALVQLALQPSELVLLMPIFVIPLAFVIWGAGLLVIGGPTWLLLHLLGVRSRRAAMICGAVLTPGGVLGYAGLNNGFRGTSAWGAAEWLSVIAFATIFGMAGSLVGRVVATVAYGCGGGGQ